MAWFGLVSLFNGISTFVGYLMPKLFSYVTWSTTERREIRNFPYPSVFELTGRQRLTVKRGIRNVGQFLAAEITNPGQNESQQMFALCDWMDKERDILDK